MAIHDYDDVGLTRLKAPAQDAEALSEVLADPDIGGFEVRTVINQPAHVVNVEVAAFFANRKPDELLLLHFSCHGVKDDSGELYFATTDTRLDLLEASAVSSGFVNKVMNRSRSSRVVLLLDCCYAGAFARGMATRASPGLDLGERLGGRGRAVLTASTALQFAFEGTDLASGDVEQEQPSVFTRALVSGLRTGEADRDLDGMVSLDELYGYMYDQVTASTPHQTPGKWVFGLEGDLYVAKRSTPVTTPSELEKEIVESVQSSVPWQRAAVVPELERVLRESHPGRALAARQALERLADDDSRQVAVAARNVLVSHVPPPRSPSEQFTVVTPAVSQTNPQTQARQPTDSSGKAPERSPKPGGAVDGMNPRIPSTPHAAPPWWRRRSAQGAVAAALAAAALVWSLLPKDVPAGKGAVAEPRLSENTILVSKFTDEGSHLMAVDARSGQEDSSFPAVRGRLPSISPDRRWVIYVAGGEATSDLKNKQFVLYRMRADGSDIKPWLNPTDTCRYASRPTWNPDDSSQLAVTCLNEQGDEVGIWKVDASGELIEPLVEDSGVRAAPTWSGNGTVIYTFMRDGGPTVLRRVEAEGSHETSDINGLGDRGQSVFDPDWSKKGLLFTRAPGFRQPGTSVMMKPDGLGTLVTVAQSSKFATFSPDGESTAWMQATEEPETYTLRTGSNDGPETDRITGRFEQPAWGSR